MFSIYKGYEIHEGDGSCSVFKGGVLKARTVSVEAAKQVIDLLIEDEQRTPADRYVEPV